MGGSAKYSGSKTFSPLLRAECRLSFLSTSLVIGCVIFVIGLSTWAQREARGNHAAWPGTKALAYLEPSTSDDQGLAVAARFESMSVIEHAQYFSPLSALSRAKSRLAGQPEILKLIATKSFPPTIEMQFAPGMNAILRTESALSTVGRTPGVSHIEFLAEAHRTRLERAQRASSSSRVVRVCCYGCGLALIALLVWGDARRTQSVQEKDESASSARRRDQTVALALRGTLLGFVASLLGVAWVWALAPAFLWLIGSPAEDALTLFVPHFAWAARLLGLGLAAGLTGGVFAALHRAR